MKTKIIIILILFVTLLLSFIINSNSSFYKGDNKSTNEEYDMFYTNVIEDKFIEDSSLNIPAIISKDDTILKYKDSDEKAILSKGEKMVILSEGDSSFLVDYNGITGYIDKESVLFYKLNETDKYALALDVSQFNINNYASFIDSENYAFNNVDFVDFIVRNNINYVYIRLGGRGWGQEGNMYYDTSALSFAEICDYFKIPYGFYFLDEALNDEEVLTEVSFVKDFLDNNSLKMNVLPLALDLENQHGKGRSDNNWDNRVELINKLVDEFSNNNIKTILYANGARIETYIKNANCSFWTAMYPKDDSIPTKDYKSFIFEEQSKIEADPSLLQNSCLNTELNRSDTQTTTYSNEYLDKVIGWQFTENRCK